MNPHEAVRVLILGNSITRVRPTPDIGWTGDCGMAASAPEKDYVHLFLDGLCKQTGRRPEACVVTIADFERQFDTYDIAATLKAEIKKGYASHDAIRGRIEGIRFQDIEVTAPEVPPSRLQGHDADHLVQDVMIENLRINGKQITGLKAAGFSQNEFVRNAVRTGEHQ